MPILKRSLRAQEGRPLAASLASEESLRETPGWRSPMSPGSPSRLFTTCAHPGCNSGWLQLWRSRSTPVFEGGWTCSTECTRARVEAALHREMLGRGTGSSAVHRHRIPIGLILLEQGWITQSQLRLALEAQQAAGKGRLGEWLVRQQAVSAPVVTRALALQWSCPVLPLEQYSPESLATAMPRLFVEAFGALPLRVAAGRLLYLGFEQGLDPALALGVEQMTGLRVESGIVQQARFREAHACMLKSRFPPVELIEAVSESALAQVFSRALEKNRPAESRLVRVHGCLWLRMWLRPQTGPLPAVNGVRDLIGSIGSF